MSELLDYIRRTQQPMDDLETIVRKWEDWGLLEQLSITQKPIAAMLYERMAQHIVGLDLQTMSSGEERTETVIFPIIYRIIKRNCNIDGVIPLYNEVVEFFNRNQTLILELEATSYNNIDAEAELTHTFCVDYIHRNLDPITPRKSIKPWVK